MTRDEFQDAMNLIADDLIEEVDALKRQKRKRTQIVRGLSLAACFCLVFGSVFVWGQTKLKDAHNGATEESIQDAGTGYPMDQEQSTESSVGSSGNSFWDLFDDSVGNSKSENTTRFSQVKVTVEELLEEGFVGSVVEDGEFAAGTELMVYDIQGEYVKYTVGSVVSVEYMEEVFVGEEAESTIADKSFVGSTAQYTIYAEKITLIEGSESE